MQVFFSKLLQYQTVFARCEANACGGIITSWVSFGSSTCVNTTPSVDPHFPTTLHILRKHNDNSSATTKKKIHDFHASVSSASNQRHITAYFA